MTPDLGLPAMLRTRLAALARRIRLLRAARGLSVLLLLAVLLFGGVFLVDLWSPLTPEALRLLLVGAGGVLLLGLVLALVVPVCRRIEPTALAALIERHHPDLAERLTSAVELAETPDDYHGSRALIALLLREADERARAVKVAQAAPARRVAWLGVVALVAVALAAAPALLWGDAYGDFARRLRLAWGRPAHPDTELTIRPLSAGGFAALGRSHTTVALLNAHSGASLPTVATLVLTDATGATSRQGMNPDVSTLPGLAAAAVAYPPAHGVPSLSASALLLGGVGPRTRAFTYFTDRLERDFTCHVEAGGVIGNGWNVVAVPPVELAPDSPTVTVRPPAYALPAVHPVLKVPGLTELTMLEYGRAEFDFRFTRPAVAAAVEVTPEQQPVRRRLFPVTLSQDRKAGRFEAPTLPPGVYHLRLLLEAEHRIDTAYDLRPLTVAGDGPPGFTEKPDLKGVTISAGQPEWVVGSDPLGGTFQPTPGAVSTSGTRAVAPGDTLRLRVAVEDLVGVGPVEVEYRVNAGPSRFEAVADGAGQRRAQPSRGVHDFRLAGKVKDGDVLLLRLKAADTRRVPRATGRDADGAAVPETDLLPHVIYYPERQGGKDRWLVLRISRLAEPVARQDILEQRDLVRDRLDAILTKLGTEISTLARLRRETEDTQRLAATEAAQVGKVRVAARGIAGDLLDLAARAGEEPAQRHVAEAAAGVAGREMQRADDSLKQALRPGLDRAHRDQRLDWTLGELGSARRKLEALREANDKLAQERLDRMKLERLAERQAELASEAAALGDKGAQAKADLDSLKAEQDRVAEELKRLAAESELFRGAFDSARAEDAKRLADEAAELAQAQRELNQAAAAAARKDLEERFGDLARRQQKLAWKAADLARASKGAAQTAGKTPLRPEDAERAAEALRDGDAADALQKQGRQLQELERLARDLDGPRELSADPREAARQLMKLQDALRRRLTDEVARKGERALLTDRIKTLSPEQEALKQATTALSLPPGHQAARDAQRQAAEHMAQAVEALRTGGHEAARGRMEQARQALERLAGSLPSAEQRRQQAINEVAQLRREQQDVARQAEQALRQLPKLAPGDPKARGELGKRLADAARRQAHLTERLSKIDPLGQAARQQSAEKAMTRALDELIVGRGDQVAATQKAASEALEKLEQALRGKQPPEPAVPPVAEAGPPPRQVAQQLAAQQKQLAEETKKVREALPKAAAQGKPALENALQKLAQEQAKLNDRAARLPAEKAPAAAQQARHPLEQARHALERNDAAEARRLQLEAAAALERLARALPDRHPEKPAPPAAPPGLPLNQHADAARALAREQQELRDAVQKAAGLRTPAPKENLLGEVSRLQQDLARAASDLAAAVAKLQGQADALTKQATGAAKSAEGAARMAQAGSPQARSAAEQAVQELRDLVKALAGSPALAKQAAALEQLQEQLSARLGKLSSDPAARQAQQAARQTELLRQSGELMKGLGKLAQETGAPQAKQAASQAQSAARDAQAAMQQAQAQSQQGRGDRAAETGQQAAQMLDRAAAQAAQAAAQLAGAAPPGAEAGKAAEALQQGQNQVAQAQGQLAQGRPGEAQGAMGKAAESLQQAAASAAKHAEQSAPPSSPGTEPGLKGASPGGLPDLGPLGKELQKYAGRPWGEVPGELRTRLLQEMRGRYGDDYGAIIQRYFEQIADTNRPRRP